MSNITSSPKKRRKDAVVPAGGMSEDEANELNVLVHVANMECEKANKIFTPKLQSLLDKLSGWLSVSQLAFYCPIFSVSSFVMSKAEVKIAEKKMSQPLNFWTVVLACPGCKKTPMFKHVVKI